MASVPSIASAATHAFSLMATLWPISAVGQDGGERRPYRISASSSLLGLRRVSTPSGASSGFSRRVESTSSMPSSRNTLLNAADQRRCVLFFQRGQQFQQPPVGFNGGEDADMFDLSGHHHFGDAFALQNVDQLSELADVDPMHGGSERRAISGEASFSMATTTTSCPSRRAVSSASSGKRPLPAIIPYRCGVQIAPVDAT